MFVQRTASVLLFSQILFAWSHADDIPYVIGNDPTAYKHVGKTTSQLNRFVQTEQLAIADLEAVERAANSPHPTPSGLTAASAYNKEVKVEGAVGVGSLIASSVRTPITDLAKEHYVRNVIDIANESLPSGSVFWNFLNARNVAEEWTADYLSTMRNGAEQSRLTRAELFARRWGQIKSVQYSYVWHEAMTANARQALIEARRSLDAIQERIKRLRKEIRDAEEAIAEAEKLCPTRPPGDPSCDVSKLVARKKAAEDQLNSANVSVHGRIGERKAKGLLAAAKYLETDLIPGLEKERDGGAEASDRALEYLNVLVNDPIQPAKSPAALRAEIVAMRQRLEKSVDPREALTALLSDAMIADGSTKQVIDNLGKVIQFLYTNDPDTDTAIPESVGNILNAVIRPYVTDPGKWSTTDWVMNVAIMAAPTMAGVRVAAVSRAGSAINATGAVAAFGEGLCGSNYDQPVYSSSKGGCALLKSIFGR